MKLSYIPVLGLCSLFDPERSSNEELYFHSKQGLLLLIAELFCGCVWFIPVVGAWVFLFLLGLFVFFHLKTLHEMKKGKRWKVPIIGPLAILLEV
jgi:uncharacterized membrane protein